MHDASQLIFEHATVIEAPEGILELIEVLRAARCERRVRSRLPACSPRF